MIYIDSNIFFYAKIMDKKYGKACAKIIEDIAEKKIKAAISSLVVIEVANALKKYKVEGIKDTIDAILSLDIDIYSIDRAITGIAAEIFDKFGISLYDCVHVATMQAYEIKEIISADKEFDKITNIRRIDPLRWK